MPRTKWEYNVITFKATGDGWIEGLVTGLDDEGLEGWEAVGMIRRDEGVGQLLMKRPK